LQACAFSGGHQVALADIDRDEHPESFIVRDKNGQALGYFYFEDEGY
jgi:hypothetical protein